MKAAGSAVAAAVILAVAACNSATVGKPTPVPGESQSSEAVTQEAPDYSLARLCELLSPEEAQQFGGSAEGEEGHALSDGHDICEWADETSLIIGFQTGTSTAEADTSPDIENTSTTVDGLPAMLALTTDPVVICEMLVDLPSGRMVATGATVLSAGEGKYDPCEVATDLANLIIPRVRDR
ncbi:DUF3558 domain-containing protein [Actinophytocola sp. KF-1]